MHNDVHVPGRQQELAPTKNIEIPEHQIKLTLVAIQITNNLSLDWQCH
ncbi:MAG TPA: hypothetical protein ACFYD9_05025 [Candidatus Wunengus sp. YC64]|nr:hypothetical protein [Candidatus Brocadiales bacterium]